MVGNYHGNHLYRSTNQGLNWSKTGWKDTLISDIVVNSKGDVFASAYVPAYFSPAHGVFHSTDDGNTWTQINRGLTNYAVKSLALAPDGHLFAGTNGSGVFRSTNSTVLVEELMHLSSQSLEQFPNPVRNTSSLIITSPQKQFASITLYDALGRIQKEVFRGMLNEGENYFSTDAEHLSEGLYFYRVFMGDRSSSTKILVEH